MSGWKTYTAAALMAAYAVGGYYFGWHDSGRMTEMLLQAAALAGLRSAIPAK